MPPKKKRKVLPEKPGRARQYLSDNFCMVPDSDLQIGHVLFLFIENEKSFVGTIQAMERCMTSNVHCTPRQLKSLVDRTLIKFKNLTREVEMKKFDEICHEPYTFCAPEPLPSTSGESSTPAASDPLPSTSGESSTPAASDPLPSTFGESSTPAASDPLPSTSGESSTPPVSVPVLSPRSSRSTHSTVWTPRKKTLKRRLDFVSKSANKMKKRHVESMKDLKAKLNSSKVKSLNQVIKRRQATIDKLRAHMRNIEKTSEVADMKKKLAQLKRKHYRLKKQKGKLIAASSCTRCEIVYNEVARLGDDMKLKDDIIRTLENEKLLLEERIVTLEETGSASSLIKVGKTYSHDMRMLVFDSVVNHVPTANIPLLIEKFVKRSGLQLEHLPHRNTVEIMARELGVISDFQVAECLMQGESLTLGFDATTQEGVHVNEVHLTSQNDCHVISIDELPGGLAEDYELHITDSINRVAEVYCAFHEVDFETCRGKMVDAIQNTLTDRVTVNHATITHLENTWGKNLNELNCHLHPLDTIASSSRSALKSVETEKGKLFGTDCTAANIVLAMNKFRFKDGKGDPKGFKTFLDRENLPRGLIPRYRGNRLHVLFHLCGIYIRYHNVFRKFLSTGTVSCGGLQGAILSDFQLPVGKVEMQVLGLVGKLLTGPWMSKFYTSSDSEISHMDGIGIVKAVVGTIQLYIESPKEILSTKMDFFGQVLIDEPTLQKLQEHPVDEALFLVMMEKCLSSIVVVLNRQYKRYFELDITNELRKQTQSARSHNIDAEEIMGMFSAAKSHAPNATLCYLSCTIRARKKSCSGLPGQSGN